MRVKKGSPPPEPPGHIATLIHTLETSGFRTVYRDEVAQGFGNSDIAEQVATLSW
jgi:hypothetical protein